MTAKSRASLSRYARIVSLVLPLSLFMGGCTPGLGASAPSDSSCATTSSSRPNGLLAAIHVPGHPFKSVATRSGRWIFVSLSTEGMAVLRRDADRICLVRVVALPGTADGLALARDDALLVVADGAGATFVDVSTAEAGARGAVLGSISEGGRPVAIEVAVSTDSRYAFLANENYSSVGVIDLARIGPGGVPTAALLGQVQVGQGPVGLDSGPVGMAVSPDGRSLYLASRIDNVGAAAPARPCDGHALGSISILDIARAAGGGPDAVLARVPAGCGPVRVTLSAGGETAWVTAQEGNQLLAFRTAALVGDPGRSLLASTPVDRAPTGIALIEADGVVAVTNSNRFRAPQAPQSITLLDARKVLSGQPGLLATIPVGAFPRELTLQGDGRTLLLTNYNSGTVDLFDVRRLPKPTG